MLALSVKQPWAELIARGKKKKEFRTWTRSCFGELLIVASKSVEAEDIADEGLDVASLVFGRAVCVVDFYKVTGDEDDYAWHFRNPRRVEPVEVKGSASLYHVPDARIRVVTEAAATRAVAKQIASRAKAVRVPPLKGRGRRASPSGALRAPIKRATPPKCTACGADTAIPILYGLRPDEGERDEVESGGCDIVIGFSPTWRCRSCGEGFGVYELEADVH
jgi:hypothetical protein